MIHTLEMSFTLLNKKNELMISMLIEYITKGIEKSILYIALSISTCKAKSLCTNISKIWFHQSSLIINGKSIIQIELPIKINK